MQSRTSSIVSFVFLITTVVACQMQADGRPLFRHALHRDAAAMFLNNSAADPKSEAGSLSVSLRGEERIE